jgi:hypothetical protein
VGARLLSKASLEMDGENTYTHLVDNPTPFHAIMQESKV